MKTFQLPTTDIDVRRRSPLRGLAVPTLLVLFLYTPGPPAVLAQTPPPEAKPPAAPPRTQQADGIQDFILLTDARPVLIRLRLDVAGRPLHTGWREAVDQLFNRLDVNHDSTLSREEINKLPPPALLFNDAFGPFQNVQFSGPPTLAQVDANRDGKVTREELANYLRQNGGAPFQTRSAQGGQQFVNVDEFGRVIQQQPTQDLNDALFNLLDTNKDGKLSRAELAAMPALLLARDENEDEMVSQEELLPRTAGTAGFAVAPRAMGNQPADDRNFIVVNPGDPGQGLARRLQARYSRLQAPAQNVKLQRQQIGLDDKSFNKLDTNKDGALDLDELAHFAQKPVDLELSVLLSKTSTVRPHIEPVSSGGEPGNFASLVKPIRDGGISLTLGNALVEIRGVKPNSAGDPNNEWAAFKQQFKALDEDGNGYLDINEANRSPFFGALFKVMDRDNDGKLFEKEMLAYLDEVRDLRNLVRAACVSLSVAEQGGSLFDLLDTDHNGRLSVREMRQSVQVLEKLKLGMDEHLTRSAIPRTLRLSVGQGGATANPNAQGFPMARSQRQAQQTAKGPLWFRKMDRNHDGDVSRREFLGTDEQFTQIDTDGDGLISVAEAESADARSRQVKKIGQ